MSSPIITDEQLEKEQNRKNTPKKTMEQIVKETKFEDKIVDSDEGFMNKEILEETEKDIADDIPSSYIEINLVSNGRIKGIPNKLHFRCYSASDAVDLNVDEDNKTKAMYEIALALYNHISNSINDSSQINPIDLDINKIIFVSYKSNLDDYLVPKLPKELNDEVTNNYCYVGLQKRFDLGDYDDESEENYCYFENLPGIELFVKPSNHEQMKSRKYRTDISRRENMAYDEATDTYTFANNQKLTFDYNKKSKSRSGYGCA